MTPLLRQAVRLAPRGTVRNWFRALLERGEWAAWAVEPGDEAK